MKYAILILLTNIFFACEGQHSNKNDLSGRIDGYPHEIDSLNLQNLYDKTKWTLYCIYCDDSLKFGDNGGFNNTKITYGKMDLKFDTLLVNKDTIEINFTFFDRDEIPYETFIRLPKGMTWGAVYLKESDGVISYTSQTIFRYFKAECIDTAICKSRYLNPIQPEVVKYINENKAELNPWFREEAIRRGILK